MSNTGGTDENIQARIERARQAFSTWPWSTALQSCFDKNIVFPAEVEYSYFSADFRLKIFLPKFLD